MKNRLAFLFSLLAAVPLLGAVGEAQRRSPRESYGARATLAARSQPVRATAYRGRSTRGYGVRDRLPAQRVWVPGRYEHVSDRVWVPGGLERIWIEPVYRTEFDACGNAIRVLVRAGCWRDVPRPGRYEVRTRRVWVPGRWVLR